MDRNRRVRSATLALAALALVAGGPLGCATAGTGPGESPAVARPPVVTVDKRKAEAHYKLGIEELRAGRAAMAIRELRAAAQYDPKDEWAQLALAEAYRLKGHPRLAEERLLEALRLRPDFQQARLNLSALYIQTERYPEAIAQAQTLLDDPTFPVPWKALTNKGYAQYHLGLLSEARSSLELAIEYHLNYWQAILNLGILEEKEGNRLEALERFDQVLALDPGPLAEAEVNYRIAEVYISLGNRDRAVEHLTAAASTRPSGPWGKRSEDYLKRLQ